MEDAGQPTRAGWISRCSPAGSGHVGAGAPLAAADARLIDSSSALTGPAVPLVVSEVNFERRAPA